MPNVKNKGAAGEREVCQLLNGVVRQVRGRMQLEQLSPEPFQRNQNQSAVGGSDIINPFGLSIEVKRQERLNLNKWWAQTRLSADQEKGMPILIYRQNNKPGWKVRMLCLMPMTCPIGEADELKLKKKAKGEAIGDFILNDVYVTDLKVPLLAEIDQRGFEKWFELYYYNRVLNTEIKNDR